MKEQELLESLLRWIHTSNELLTILAEILEEQLDEQYEQE